MDEFKDAEAGSEGPGEGSGVTWEVIRGRNIGLEGPRRGSEDQGKRGQGQEVSEGPCSGPTGTGLESPGPRDGF